MYQNYNGSSIYFYTLFNPTGPLTPAILLNTFVFQMSILENPKFIIELGSKGSEVDKMCQRVPP